MVLKTIHQKEDGTYTADGTAWTVKDYDTRNGREYEIDLLIMVKDGGIIKKVLKMTDITDTVSVFANEDLS